MKLDKLLISFNIFLGGAIFGAVITILVVEIALKITGGH